jgi:hypothetical protein
MYSGPVFAALSFAAYLFAAIYVEADKKKVDQYVLKSKQSFSVFFLNMNNSYFIKQIHF